MEKANAKTLFISDVHLGAKASSAESLLHLLKTVRPEKVVLVGDIIDGWKLKRGVFYWDEWHTKVLRKILGFGKEIPIVYVTGNHDDFLRSISPFTFGNITICDEYVHELADGRKMLVCHGDVFDGLEPISPWLYSLGDRAYDLCLYLNQKFNWLRHKFGFGYWSLSSYLKQQVKTATNHVQNFEACLIRHAKHKDCVGVICGHIHKPAMKTFDDGFVYVNTGDWVESCSAIIETEEGLKSWCSK